jgi:hypothetical protein
MSLAMSDRSNLGLTETGGAIFAKVSDDLEQIAGLLRKRNAIDENIGAIIRRPVASGPFRGQTVSVKWYLKRTFDV